MKVTYCNPKHKPDYSCKTAAKLAIPVNIRVILDFVKIIALGSHVIRP